MIVLVSDTSVIVDLERGRLLDACFQLPFQFAVPDLLYKRELLPYGGEELCKRGLRVEELDPGELTIAASTRREHPKLSLPDAYAYSLAQSRKWALLTGDGELRTVAQNTSVEFHGVLWVLDQMYSNKTLAGSALAVALSLISSHPRCRLPRNEVTERLNLYKQ